MYKGSIVCRVCKPNLSNNRLPTQQTNVSQCFPGICVANRGLGNKRNDNIVADKWFGLVSTADYKIFIVIRDAFFKKKIKINK